VIIAFTMMLMIFTFPVEAGTIGAEAVAAILYYEKNSFPFDFKGLCST
jgi:hypothetical protein